MTKNLSSEISFLMKTAIDINKKVGGVKAYCMSCNLFRGWEEGKGQI